MTSLTGMFLDETQPRSATEAQILERIADATVADAKRRRAVRLGLRSLASVAVVGALVVAGALVLQRSADGPPAATTPSATATVIAPDAQLDARLPQAPVMTEEDWAGVDGSWDVEFAAFANAVPVADGASAAAYLTAPGGERRLAYSADDLDMRKPVMQAWDPVARTVVLFDWENGALAVLNLTTGELHSVAATEGLELLSANNLGVDSSGLSYFGLDYRDAAGDDHSAVYRADGEAISHVADVATWAEMPVWEDRLMARTTDGLTLVTLPSATQNLVPDSEGCFPQAWTASGTFLAFCAATESWGNVVEFDPVTGSKKVVVRGADEPAFDPSTLTQSQAIDDTRSREGFNAAPSIRPPQVTEADGAMRNLGDGFNGVPDAYAVIFGARP